MNITFCLIGIDELLTITIRYLDIAAGVTTELSKLHDINIERDNPYEWI